MRGDFGGRDARRVSDDVPRRRAGPQGHRARAARGWRRGQGHGARGRRRHDPRASGDPAGKGDAFIFIYTRANRLTGKCFCVHSSSRVVAWAVAVRV